jgi:hypothetical protein
LIEIVDAFKFEMSEVEFSTNERIESKRALLLLIVFLLAEVLTLEQLALLGVLALDALFLADIFEVTLLEADSLGLLRVLFETPIDSSLTSQSSFISEIIPLDLFISFPAAMDDTTDSSETILALIVDMSILLEALLFALTEVLTDKSSSENKILFKSAGSKVSLLDFDLDFC